VKPQDLKSRIKSGELPPVLCLCGEEGYFRDLSLRQIIDHAVPADARDFNLTVFHGKEVSARQILEEVQTLPVFVPRRVVVVKETQLLGAADSELLLDYLQSPAPETILVLVADKVDKRKKFFQQLSKAGGLVEFKPLYDNQIPGFVRDLLQEKGLRITESGMALFCRRAGGNLQEIAAELEKLAAFLGERDLIDRDDVAEVVCDVRADSVFELTDALGQRRLPEALWLLHRLLDEGEAPLGLLAMIVRHYRQLWKIRELLDRGTGVRELPAAVGVNPYFINGLITQAGHFSSARFRGLFSRFLETDLALKSSGAHASALLEGLLLEIAGEERT